MKKKIIRLFAAEFASNVKSHIKKTLVLRLLKTFLYRWDYSEVIKYCPMVVPIGFQVINYRDTCGSLSRRLDESK